MRRHPLRRARARRRNGRSRRSERLAKAPEQALAVGGEVGDRLTAKIGELPEKGLLLVVELAGRLDPAVDVEVTACAATRELWHAVPPQGQDGARLRPRFDAQGLLAM